MHNQQRITIEAGKLAQAKIVILSMFFTLFCIFYNEFLTDYHQKSSLLPYTDFLKNTFNYDQFISGILGVFIFFLIQRKALYNLNTFPK